MLSVVCAAALSRTLTAFLYEVKREDPLIILTVPLGLIAVSLTASYAPAQRAMKVDPMIALKWE
ncbi:MAG: hypothetical protein M3Y72_23115 [Acidobacteriota bacterium]|nr:hypothetical protein [Acidobacteriota bacterium]